MNAVASEVQWEQSRGLELHSSTVRLAQEEEQCPGPAAEATHLGQPVLLPNTAASSACWKCCMLLSKGENAIHSSPFLINEAYLAQALAKRRTSSPVCQLRCISM